MHPRCHPSPPWPWATGPTRPTRSEPSLGRSELPRDRYTHMSQIEQVNSLPCFRLARHGLKALCGELPRAHDLRLHSCSWCDPQKP